MPSILYLYLQNNFKHDNNMWFFCFLVSLQKSYSTCIKAVVPPPLLDLCKNPWSQTRKFFYHYLLLMWLHWIPIYFQCIQKCIKPSNENVNYLLLMTPIWILLHFINLSNPSTLVRQVVIKILFYLIVRVSTSKPFALDIHIFPYAVEYLMYTSHCI